MSNPAKKKRVTAPKFEELSTQEIAELKRGDYLQPTSNRLQDQLNNILAGKNAASSARGSLPPTSSVRSGAAAADADAKRLEPGPAPSKSDKELTKMEKRLYDFLSKVVEGDHGGIARHWYEQHILGITKEERLDSIKGIDDDDGFLLTLSKYVSDKLYAAVNKMFVLFKQSPMYKRTLHMTNLVLGSPTDQLIDGFIFACNNEFTISTLVQNPHRGGREALQVGYEARDRIRSWVLGSCGSCLPVPAVDLKAFR